MQDFWSQSVILIILSLIYSFLLTGIVGLLPAILIRYYLIGRPLSKTISFLIVSLFWIVNFIIFTMLGSKGHSHVGLIMAALVSYYIYRTHSNFIGLLSDTIHLFISFWRSFLSLFLLLRYLRKRKIVFLSIAAVSLSTALLIVVTSLFTGFIRAFEQAAVYAMGDVVVIPPVKFNRYPEFVDRLEKLGAVEAATASLSGQGLLWLGPGNIRGAKVWGIDAGPRAEVTGLKGCLLKQKNSPGPASFDFTSESGNSNGMGGFIGIAVAAEPDEITDEYDFEKIEREMIGSKAVLITGIARESDNGGPAPEFDRKNIRFTVTDIAYTGVYLLDKTSIYLPIERLQKVLYPEEVLPVADQVQIKIAEGVSGDSAIAQIRGVWEDFASNRLGWGDYLINYTEIETSKQMQRQYVAEIYKQMGVLLLIFSVVSFGVVLLVFCIFYMIVRLKQKDVAVVKSCGASSSSVALTFLGFGVVVGTVGSAIGILLGYVVTRNINTIEDWIRIVFGLKLWKSSVYMFSQIPNQVNWGFTVVIVIAAVIAVSLGSLLPAIQAARTNPVDILRFE